MVNSVSGANVARPASAAPLEKAIAMVTVAQPEHLAPTRCYRMKLQFFLTKRNLVVLDEI
jgi:hypothetical protein